jgi:hypothetical protein
VVGIWSDEQELVLGDRTVKEHSAAERDESAIPDRRVRLPGFLIEEEVGLGDLIKKVSYSVGVKPCSGCEKRAAALNRWMTFSR